MTQAPDALVGHVIADKYRLVSVLGAGGFAIVYGASHVHLPELRFAVKVLRRVHLDDPLVLARFEREAKTIAGLKSRYTVRLVDFGVFRGDQPYIVMEYVAGQSLRAVLDGHGPLTPMQTAFVMLGVLRAVEEAHSRGIVHRDLKPENIVVDWDSEEGLPVPRVLDFGIAKVVDGDTGGTTATSTGVTMCTPRYAAPEVLFRSAMPASDIYSLGLIIHELLCGVDPYDVDTPYEYARKHVDPAPVPLDPDVASSPLASIVRKACKKAPEERYTTAAAMLDDVREVYEQLRAAAADPLAQLRGLEPWTRPSPDDTTDPFAGSVAFDPTVDIALLSAAPVAANATVTEADAAAATKFDRNAPSPTPRHEPRVRRRSLGGAALVGAAITVVGLLVVMIVGRTPSTPDAAVPDSATPAPSTARVAPRETRDNVGELVDATDPGSPDSTAAVLGEGSAATAALNEGSEPDADLAEVDADVDPPIAADAVPDASTATSPGDSRTERGSRTPERESRQSNERRADDEVVEPTATVPAAEDDGADAGTRRPINPWGNE